MLNWVGREGAGWAWARGGTHRKLKIRRGAPVYCRALRFWDWRQRAVNRATNLIGDGL